MDSRHPCSSARKLRTSLRRIPLETTPETRATAPDTVSSRPPRREPALLRELHQLHQPPRLCSRDRDPKRRDPVIPPPLVILLRTRPFPGLDQQPLLEHPLNRPVQRPGAQFQLAIGPRRDILNNGVPMPVFLRNRHQNMKRRRRRRKQCLWIFLSHTPIIPTLAILN